MNLFAGRAFFRPTSILEKKRDGQFRNSPESFGEHDKVLIDLWMELPESFPGLVRPWKL